MYPIGTTDGELRIAVSSGVTPATNRFLQLEDGRHVVGFVDLPAAGI